MFFLFDSVATIVIYSLSLHDALPIFWGIDVHSCPRRVVHVSMRLAIKRIRFIKSNLVAACMQRAYHAAIVRSEEHTSELQSRQYLVCRLLLEKKKNK